MNSVDDIHDIIRVVELLKRNKSSLYQYQDLAFRRTVNEEDNPSHSIIVGRLLGE